MTDVLITAGELAEFLKKEPCVVIDTRNPVLTPPDICPAP